MEKTLVFKVGIEEYGVPISQVVSIERMQEINPYPNRPAHVLGVTTIRERITPVVDMRSALNGEPFEPKDSARIIVVLARDSEVGLVVDAATDVIEMDLALVQQPHLLERKKADYLKGMADMDGRLIILIDAENMLEDTANLDDLKDIKDQLEL